MTIDIRKLRSDIYQENQLHTTKITNHNISYKVYIHGFAPDCCNSIANALEIPQSRTKLLMYPY